MWGGVGLYVALPPPTHTPTCTTHARAHTPTCMPDIRYPLVRSSSPISLPTSHANIYGSRSTVGWKARRRMRGWVGAMAAPRGEGNSKQGSGRKNAYSERWHTHTQPSIPPPKTPEMRTQSKQKCSFFFLCVCVLSGRKGSGNGQPARHAPSSSQRIKATHGGCSTLTRCIEEGSRSVTHIRKQK